MDIIEWGVAVYCRIALAALSLSSDPSGRVLSSTMRLAAFTPSSERPFDWGYAIEEIRW